MPPPGNILGTRFAFRTKCRHEETLRGTEAWTFIWFEDSLHDNHLGIGIEEIDDLSSVTVPPS